MSQLIFETKELSPTRLWLRAAGVVDESCAAQVREWAEQTTQHIAQMHERSGSLISCVFDLLEVSGLKDPAAVSELVNFQRNNKPYIHRTALLIKDPEMRLALSVVGALADRYNISSFASNQEAEKWAFSEQE